jgi:Zn-dependent peptidase ImmA (M78 family)
METDEQIYKPNIKLAREMANKLLGKAQILDYPIRLKSIAEQVPEIFIDGREFKDEISGVQATYKGKTFIAYNKDHPTTRKRFTVAHELGHALLGHTAIGFPVDLYSKECCEIEANQFAAELLMPVKMLKQAVKKSKTVVELALDFWVSKDAMSWRVMETGIYNLLDSWS